jgi:hypothetical protein
MSQDYYRCCICGKMEDGYGNNPWPISNKPEDKCCDICNKWVVLPARFKLMKGK